MKFRQTGSAVYADDGSLEKSCLVQVDTAKNIPRVHIQLNHVDFISPVDGTHIHSRRQLVEHNKRHNVSNDLDSLREQTQRSLEVTELSPSERKADIRDAIERSQSSGYSRRSS